MAHVTFIHGMANKPAKDELVRLWSQSLAAGDGIDLGAEGITSEMLYWADVLYETPAPAARQESAVNEAVAEQEPAPEPLRLGLAEMDADEKLWTARLAAKLAIPEVVEEVAAAPDPAMRDELERIPLPWAIKERLMKRLLRDVHHYLFNTEHSPRPGTTYRVMDEIRRRAVETLSRGAGKSPHVVVSHSMGTVIAYDVLQRDPRAPRVDCLITIGSPLGLDEIQDKMRPGWSRADGFPGAKVGGGWANFFDHLDPVCGFDPNVANDFRRADTRVVDDVEVVNRGAWRHDISQYLSREELRGVLRGFLGS
jgi:hypothetical protein